MIDIYNYNNANGQEEPLINYASFNMKGIKPLAFYIKFEIEKEVSRETADFDIDRCYPWKLRNSSGQGYSLYLSQASQVFSFTFPSAVDMTEEEKAANAINYVYFSFPNGQCLSKGVYELIATFTPTEYAATLHKEGGESQELKYSNSPIGSEKGAISTSRGNRDNKYKKLFFYEGNEPLTLDIGSGTPSIKTAEVKIYSIKIQSPEGYSVIAKTKFQIDNSNKLKCSRFTEVEDLKNFNYISTNIIKASTPITEGLYVVNIIENEYLDYNGAKYLKILDHDVSKNPSNKDLYFTDENEAKRCFIPNKFSRLGDLNSELFKTTIDQEYEFLLKVSNSQGNEQYVWTQTESPLNDLEGSTDGLEESILFKNSNNNSYLTFYNNGKSIEIGKYTNTQNNEYNHICLYVKISDTPYNAFSMITNTGDIIMNEFIEIKEEQNN